MIKIYVVVNYCYNTIELQLIQYIIEYIKLYVMSKHLYFCLLSYIASLKIHCSACRFCAQNK